MLLVSGAPCTGFAAPAGPAQASTPADPCKQRIPASTPCCCVQAACQSLLVPPASTSGPPVPAAARLAFDQITRGLVGQRVPPPTPPPRPLMS